MRREQFSLEVANVAWIESNAEPRLPTLTIEYEGDGEVLRERLRGANDNLATAGTADLAVRLQRSADSGEAEAVVALTHRLTGDYILEVTATPAVVLSFTKAARRYGEAANGGPKYRARLVAGRDEVAVFEKETFLVYGPDGELLRQHSLIPGGVEL